MAYSTYHASGGQTNANYQSFYDVAMAATASSSSFSALVSNLNNIRSNDAVDLSNANSLATSVMTQQSSLTSLETTPVSDFCLHALSITSCRVI